MQRRYERYKPNDFCKKSTQQESILSAKALLASSGNVTADESKALRTHFTAKAARYFLLDFHHAQIALGEIVVEGHDAILVIAQALSQIACGVDLGRPR